jgi:hypothetical protein
MGLAESIGWRRLLHYRPDVSGSGVTSEVDGQVFFLSSTGRHDPEAELEATLRAFLVPLHEGQEDAHALCRFPARRRWLDERLHFEGFLHRPTCPALDRYLTALDPEAIAVVYSSPYLGNAVSAFGHTFMRIRKRRPAGAAESSVLLDYGVDFLGVPDTKNPLLYVYGGLAGTFPGVVRFHSYEYKIREYGYEGRDLWEYDLALTHEEVTLLSLHLFELSATHMNFSYLRNNCSYGILSIIEAGAPRVDLISRLDAVVVPKDTIRALVSVPGLVRAIGYRPSVQSIRRADPAPPMPVQADKAPDLAPGSMRFTLGNGATTQYRSEFVAVGYRLVFHDLADPPDGSSELSQVQFLDAQMRYDIRRGTLTLDHITFADLVSLDPFTRFRKPLSWKARAFAMHLHDRACPDCLAQGLEGGVGATVASDGERVALFLMADAYAETSSSLDGIDRSFVRIGVGPYVGVRVHLPGQMVGLLTASWSYLPGSTLVDTYDLRAALRCALARDVALGVEAAVQPLSTEALLTAYLYF